MLFGFVGVKVRLLLDISKKLLTEIILMRRCIDSCLTRVSLVLTPGCQTINRCRYA